MDKFYSFLEDIEGYEHALVESIKEAYILLEAESMDNILDKIKIALEPATGIYLVGGAVRDEILGNPNKDMDILVTGMRVKDIIDALKPISDHVDLEGESFSAVKAKIDGEDFDFVIPRTEQSTGVGHKDFKVTGDPFLSPESDAGRRDFTMNAIMKNLRTGEIFDPTGGLTDIKDKKIRAVGNANERFSEDPLRMLRGLQFASRMGFDISDDTLESIKSNSHLLSNITKERIFEEFNKAFSKSKSTDKIVELLNVTGIGNMLFGNDFKPRIVSLNVDSSLKKLYGFISFFMDGGNPERMNSTNEQLYYLQLAKNLENNKHPIDYIRNKKDAESIDNLKEFFTNQPDVSFLIEKILHMPVLSSQLAVTADDLMKIGIPQVQLGKVMKEILKNIFDGNIENSKSEILDRLR